MPRRVRTNAQWQSLNRIALEIPPIPGKPGVNRDYSWRQSFGPYAPEHSGASCQVNSEKWNSLFKRFRRWVKTDTFYHMFKALASDAELKYAMTPFH